MREASAVIPSSSFCLFLKKRLVENWLFQLEIQTLLRKSLDVTQRSRMSLLMEQSDLCKNQSTRNGRRSCILGRKKEP